MRAHGFAAIRDRASTSGAGFALFRRRRVIQGSGDEGYRPERIFGKSNTYAYQRIFGELHLEGFEVTHTKDGFKWDENEETFLDLLREELSKEAMPLLQQARLHRVGERAEDLQQGATVASDRTSESVEKNARPVIDDLQSNPSVAAPTAELPARPFLTHREVTISLPPWTSIVTIEQTNDPRASRLSLPTDRPVPTVAAPVALV